MTKSEAIARIASLDSTQQVEWMLSLGAELTVAARAAAYEAGTDVADGTKLRGFNEIQHRIYGRIRDLQHARDWTADSFIEMLTFHGKHFGIMNEVAWAIEQSLASARIPRS